jgi:hypothetical protein
MYFQGLIEKQVIRDETGKGTAAPSPGDLPALLAPSNLYQHVSRRLQRPGAL